MTTIPHQAPHPPVSVRCLVNAAAWYRLPPDLLLAILMQEGGRNGMSRANSNGSRDLGPMQINTVNLPVFTAHGVYRSSIRDDACTNIFAGAYLLRRNLDHSDGRIWEAVGDYHSHTPGLAHSYRQAIHRRLVLLYTRHRAMVRKLRAETRRRIRQLASTGGGSGSMLTIRRPP